FLFNCFDDFYFFSDTIDQVELCFGKENGKRNTREPPTGTYIQDFSAGLEGLNFGYAERMQNMRKINLFHIFTRNYIYFFVPVFINLSDGRELAQLFCR